MNDELQKHSILIVEDDVEFAWSLQRILSKAGYKIMVVEDGINALKVLADVPPDLVITDYRMEPISGLDLISSIRRQNFHIPIVLLTAYGDPSVSATASALGADSCLTKPIKRKEILVLIATLLGRRT